MLRGPRLRPANDRATSAGITGAVGWGYSGSVPPSPADVAKPRKGLSRRPPARSD